MTVRALSLPTLLVCAALAASAGPARAQPPSAADDNAGVAATSDERVIRAGDTRLHVIVENAPSRLRADELQRWLAECANAALTAFGRFP
ncbi:hypothetical protein AB4084_15180, partial [Lysobacter sp. 2RAB21]